MDYKKAFEKLVKIAENQQKIIMKLAQALPPDAAPTGSISFTPGKESEPAVVSPSNLKPNDPKQTQAEGQLILSALPPPVQSVVNSITVSQGTVNVAFKPGGATQANYDAILAAVKQLQVANKLPGQSYKVHVVA